VFEQFSQHAAAWRQAIGCLCLIDGLVSLAVYSSSVDGVFPQLEEEEGAAGLLDIEEGRHPCLDLAGDALIPNDTRLSQEKSLIVLTGTGTYFVRMYDGKKLF
jgi:DNA mismatch repair ATPase MutS